MVGIIFAGTFGLPNNAYATCINTLQSQTIAAAYNGDEVPTVHQMNTCSGDDLSYQIPIATSIIFDGVEYSDIYATTNSVITFGRPDGTYWTYPSTPSISLYSMDWYPGASNTDGLDISYSEGGFQINLNMVPFGNYGAQPSTVNILVAITNTGGISVAYSYQGPEYNNMRTGVRLHDGSIVSLEAWGATQVQPGETLPTLQPEPVVDPTASPEPTPLTPEQQQTVIQESAQLASEISDLNSLIASINQEPAPEPEVTPEPSAPPVEPEPDIVVDPEIITPDDPRFPDGDGQTQPSDPTPSPDSGTTDDGNSNPNPEPEPTPQPSREPSPQPTDINQDPKTEPDRSDDEDDLISSPDNTITNNAISEKELKELNSLIEANMISQKDVTLLIELAKSDEVILEAVQEFTDRAEENKDAPMPYTIADAITEVQAEKLLENPIAVLTNIDLDVVFSPSEWGKDMTDDQREKVQEIVVSVIIASNLISASMTRRIG